MKKEIEDYLTEVLAEKQDLEETLDFKFKTDFWELFSLADLLGPKGIRENYEQVFELCKDSVGKLTELVLVLNLKISVWYQVDDSIGRTYDELWKNTDSFAMETLKGEDLHYYLSTLD